MSAKTLIERLREWDGEPDVYPLCNEAAEALARQQLEIADLKEMGGGCVTGMDPPSFHPCKAYARQQRVIEKQRKVLQEVHLLSVVMNSGRTHYEGCSADHPWCEVYGKVSQALAEDPTP